MACHTPPFKKQSDKGNAFPILSPIPFIKLRTLGLNGTENVYIKCNQGVECIHWFIQPPYNSLYTLYQCVSTFVLTIRSLCLQDLHLHKVPWLYIWGDEQAQQKHEVYSRNILACMHHKYATCCNSANKISMCHVSIQLVKKVPCIHSPDFKVRSPRPFCKVHRGQST